jgi:hypothetical protein
MSPQSLTNAMLFPDPSNRRVDLFGGIHIIRHQGQMWQWSGTNWKRWQVSELELHVQLHAAGRQRRHRVSEKWRGNDPYITDVVRVIEHVEGI